MSNSFTVPIVHTGALAENIDVSIWCYLIRNRGVPIPIAHKAMH